MKFMNVLFRKILSRVTTSNHGLSFALGQASILASRARSEQFKNLWDAEVKIYSQWGEDGILDYIFGKLGTFKPRVIEVGAGNFTECNSRFLAENLNASVVAIDGRSDLTPTMAKLDLMWKSHILGIQTWVTPSNINTLIDTALNFMGGIDLFSLDLDGNDYWIIKTANLTTIRVVVVEYNPVFGNSMALSVPEEDGFDRKKQHYSWLYYGASLKAYVSLLSQKGFVFIGTNRVGNNAFFVTSEDSHLFPFIPNPTDDCYFDWRIRESRDEKEELNYLSGKERMNEIADLPLVNVDNNQVTNLRANFL